MFLRTSAEKQKTRPGGGIEFIYLQNAERRSISFVAGFEMQVSVYPHLPLNRNDLGGQYTYERYRWSVDWQKYARTLKFFDDLYREMDGIVVHRMLTIVLEQSRDWHKIARHSRVFGFDVSSGSRGTFIIPTWWLVCMSPVHQQKSGLCFPYIPPTEGLADDAKNLCM